jgi:hypothetical protein
MMRSPTKERTPFVMPIVMRALGMQCPGCVLSQKKETGVHWRMFEVKAATAQHYASISSANWTLMLTCRVIISPIQRKILIIDRN